MRFLGQTEILAFADEYPAQAEVLCAWVEEMKARRWHSLESLAADFYVVDISRPPRAVFEFASAPIRVETMVDVRAGVVVVTSIERTSPRLSNTIYQGTA